MRLRLLVIFGVLLTLAQSCSANDYSYKVWFWTQSSPATGGRTAIWAESGAGKGHEWGETIWPNNPSPAGVLIGFYSVEGISGRDSTTGWYDGNAREFVSTGNPVVIDNLYF